MLNLKIQLKDTHCEKIFASDFEFFTFYGYLCPITIFWKKK
jgi:hypothetical protein